MQSNRENNQNLFEVLIDNLLNAGRCNTYFCYNFPNSNVVQPIDGFLKSVKDDLSNQNLDEKFIGFLRGIYQRSFHTGEMNKGRNNLEMNFNIRMGNEKTRNTLILWVDLDNVAAELNNYLNNDPPRRFKIPKPLISSTESTNENGIWLNYAQCNLVIPMQSSLFLNFIVGVSLYVALIAVLAVASIIALSTAGILTAAGLVAGVVSYGLFKSRTDNYTRVADLVEYPSKTIEDIFRDHLSLNNRHAIAQSERIEVINDHAPN